MTDEHVDDRNHRRGLVRLVALAGLVLAGMLAPSPTAGADAPAEGSFVTVTDNGEIYRIVGGAPLHVSAWASVGFTDPQDTTQITRAELDALPQFPADGTYVRTVSPAGFYRFAGGAPTAVDNNSGLDDLDSALQVDAAVIALAGSSTSPWNHVRAHPADGTFVTAAGTIYRFAGGAPIAVSDWNVFGGPQPATAIDIAAIDNAQGTRSKYRFVYPTPIDGTYVSTPDGAVFRIAGGAPVHISSWAAVGGQQPTVVIDPEALDRAGQPGPWRHLNFFPTPGTVLRAGPTGPTYTVATDGSPRAGGATAGAIVVDPAAIANAGPTPPWNHLAAPPSWTLTVAKTGQGVGSIVSSPAGINCGSLCLAAFRDGTSVTLTTAPGLGSTFAGWSGACTGTGTCTVSMTEARTVTATFTVELASRAVLGAGFTGVSPTRLFDTRPGEPHGTVTVTKTRIDNTTELRIKVTGTAGIPTTGVGAVSLNVTATEPTGTGFITVWPCDTRPRASNLNFTSGATTPNAVIAPVSPTGDICFYSNAPTHLIADINGWFPTGGQFTGVSPTRIFDTRPGEPHGTVTVTKTRIDNTTELRIKVTGTAGIPTTGVGAVSLNVTATEPTGTGFITVWPCDTRPRASNLNFTSGATTPNAVIAPVSPTGDICFYSNAPTHLIADINGWFPTGGQFTGVSPTRIFDTRPGEPHGTVTVTKTRIDNTTELRIKVTGTAGIPTTGVGAVSLNVTATEPTGTGFITVWPCDTRPRASNLNFTSGATTPNAVIAPVSPTGDICFYSNAPTHLIADINGWFASATS